MDPEIFLKGASGPPHYNALDASYQICRILVPNNMVASLHCRKLCKDKVIKDEERELIPMIEEGLRKNQKPLQELEIAVCRGEEDRILASLTTICSGSLKSLHLHIPICVSKWVSAMRLSNNDTASALKVFSPT